MQVDVRYRPAYALALVTLDAAESVQVEAGAMVAMSPDVAMRTKARGGLLESLARSVLGGESFFINTYTATSPSAELALAPAIPGDVAVVELDGQRPVLLQSGSYLASSSGL